MKSALLTQLLIGLITFLIILVIGKMEIIRRRRFTVIFFLFYFVDNLTIALANQFPSLQFIPDHSWGGFLVCGWSGKLYSILIIALWSSFVGSHSPQGDFHIATMVYLAIMPGLNEELVYRVVLPARLDRLFTKNWTLASAKISRSIVITTMLFGLLHGLWLDDHFEIHIELVWIRNAFLSGFIFAWLRERTGSLIMPVVTHAVWDCFLFLPRMI